MAAQVKDSRSLQQDIGEKDSARRRFFKAAVGVLTSLATVALAAPLVATLIGPMYRRQKVGFASVGRLDALPQGEPVNLTFSYQSEEAYMRQTSLQDVWVVKHSPTEVTVFSPICTHLGCHLGWDAQERQFRCPCHGSVFSMEGKVLAGPAPRPLDTLPSRIENGELLVEWERFEPGVRQKVQV